jgi:hypothetical protein
VRAIIEAMYLNATVEAKGFVSMRAITMKLL